MRKPLANQPHLEPAITQRSIHAIGESDVSGRIEVAVRQALMGSPNETLTINSQIDGVQIDSTALNRFRPVFGKQIANDFQLDLIGDVKASYAKRSGQHDYDVDIVIHNGSYSDTRLPSKIDQLRGRVQISPQGVRLYPTQANFGEALCRARGSVQFAPLRTAVAPQRLGMGSQRKSSIQDKWRLPFTLGETDLHVSAESLVVEPRLATLLPERAAKLWRAFEPQGRLGFQAHLTNPAPLDDQPWKARASVVCQGIDVQFDKFPYPVKQLVGSIEIEDGYATSESLTGQASGKPVHCEFRVPVRLHHSLPVVREKMIVMRTEGAIPIDDVLIGALTPRETLAVPMSLTRGQNMAATASPSRTVIQQQAPQPRSTPRTISKLESFVRSLHARGAMELASATIQTDSQGKTTRRFDLRVTGGTLRYDQFAYPLYNVDGRIQVQDNLVRMIGFTANNAGSARIACDGLYQLSELAKPELAGAVKPPTPSELSMRFRIADLAMDHSLRSSLPISSRQVWDSLAPAGTLDQLDVRVRKHGTAPIDLSLHATQLESGSLRSVPGSTDAAIPSDSYPAEQWALDRSNLSSNGSTPLGTSFAQQSSLYLRPVAIPYRIDITGGTVRYQDDQVWIENLKGRHDASHLVADGGCTRHPSGRWLLSLDLHSGCRLIPDDELIRALPDQMNRAMRSLDLRGPISVRGHTNVLLAQDETTSPIFDWDLRLQLEGNRIADVGPVHSIRGEMAVRGLKDGDTLRADGNVAFDSLHAYGLQITSLRGPFSINDDRLMLGTLSKPVQEDNSTQPANGPASRPTSRPSPMVGQLFDGILDVSGLVTLSTGDFDVGVSISNSQIATVLAELGQTRSDMTGRLDMNSRIEGRLGDIDLLKGTGTARMSGANLYQLPLLVQVLNLLRITPTEDVAFTDGETEFAIYGEDLNFNRLMLWGDLVALDGGGTLSRREHLDLSFNTRVSPQNLFSKVISPLRDSRYTLWTIEVDGPIESPTISRRSLNGFSQTMEDWFPVLVRSTTANTSAISR